MALPDDETVEFVSPLLGSKFFAPPAPRVTFTFGAVSHPGKVRPNNQDHYALLRRTRSQQVLLTNLPQDEVTLPEDEAYLMIVADGIGGATFGDLASRLAVRTAWEAAASAPSWLMKLAEFDAEELRKRMRAYARVIQEAFRELSRANPALASMGTTWTSAYLMGRDAVIAHVGDSRAYHHSADGLQQVTDDQTVAQEYIDAGMPPEHTHGYRNILTNYFGAEAGDVEPELYHVKLQPGDWLLLCTDGLSDSIPDKEFGRQLDHARDVEPQAVCEKLLETALQHGGHDNITVLAARCQSPGVEGE